MTSTAIDPPEGVPSEVIGAFDDCDDDQLRGVIHYAQQLLRDQPSLTDSIESREDEDLVRVEDHGDYTFAVVERAEGADRSGGRFAYRVRWEPDAGDGGKYRWHYLGRVTTELGGA